MHNSPAKASKMLIDSGVRDPPAELGVKLLEAMDKVRDSVGGDAQTLCKFARDPRLPLHFLLDIED
jgi:hypothetical protein